MEKVLAGCFDGVLIMATNMDSAGELTHAPCVRFFLTMEEMLIFLRRVAQLRSTFVRIADERVLPGVIYSECQRQFVNMENGLSSLKFGMKNALSTTIRYNQTS